MSLKKSFFILFSLVIIATTAGISLLIQKPNESRKIASYGKAHLTLAGKHTRPIDIKFDSDPAAIQADRDYTIKAKVILLQPITAHLDYKWILPEGVEVVSGEIENTWASVQGGQEIETEITLEGLNNDTNQVIVLQVLSKDDAQSKIGYSAVFSTRPEETLESVAPLRTQALQKLEMSSEAPAAVIEVQQ